MPPAPGPETNTQGSVVLLTLFSFHWAPPLNFISAVFCALLYLSDAKIKSDQCNLWGEASLEVGATLGRDYSEGILGAGHRVDETAGARSQAASSSSTTRPWFRTPTTTKAPKRLRKILATCEVLRKWRKCDLHVSIHQRRRELAFDIRAKR
jgi:hypothetical protein